MTDHIFIRKITDPLPCNVWFESTLWH